MTRHRILRMLVLLGVTWIAINRASADSAVDLISGFDQSRIESAYPTDDESTTGELAKLVYRLRRIDRTSLEARATTDLQSPVGDALRLSGTVVAVDTLAVPVDLVEFLEFTSMYRFSVATGTSEVTVVADSTAAKVRVGDRISAIGVVMRSRPSTTTAMATASLQWFPKQVPNRGWQLLRDAGVDIGLIARLGDRDRQPLVAADNDVFYEMLAASKALANRNDLAVPRRVKPITLLQSPDSLHGDWIEVELETVQITRVFVTNPERQAQIGSDHYYQIDAVGDLENVIVKIEPSSADTPVRPDRPALFEGRYPVSLVMTDLPDFMQSQIADLANGPTANGPTASGPTASGSAASGPTASGSAASGSAASGSAASGSAASGSAASGSAASGTGAIVTSLRTKIGVQAFYFRLWSYESDFMNQHGGGNQFGPLLIGAKLTENQAAPAAPWGLGGIGIAAAIAVVGGIVVTFLWHRITSAEDRRVRNDRQIRESERIQFPADRN